jgi:hypothetical protein
VYNKFIHRVGKCGATHYTSLRSTTDPRKKKENSDTFVRYLLEIQDLLFNTWRISPETIQEFGHISNFEAMHHSMWLQAKRDLTKELLPMSYYVMT